VAKNLVVKIAHELPHADALSRVDHFIRQFLIKYESKVAEFDAGWDTNRLEGRARALGQSVTGSIDVGPQEVVISLQLPMLLTVMSKQIEGFLKSRAENALRAN